MSLVAVASAKHSPGASTLAELFVALWPQGRCLLVDADPAGSDWLLRPGIATEPGLMTLAADSRRELATRVVLDHVQVLSERLAAVVGPASSRQATAALDILGDRLGPHLRALDDVDAVADCGRLAPASPSLPLVHAAHQTILVSGSAIAEVVHMASWVKQLTEDGCDLAIVLTKITEPAGGQPTYQPAEVADALGVEVLGVVPNDRRSVSHILRNPGSLNGLARSRIVRAVEPIVASIAARVASDATHGGTSPTLNSEPTGGLAEMAR
jgi:hypothetical protein